MKTYEKPTARLVVAARNYEEEEFELFKDELGWEDWMESWTDSEDGEVTTENENKEIDKYLAEVFEMAHDTDIDFSKVVYDMCSTNGNQLAKKSGIPVMTINDLIKGKTYWSNINLRNALILAKALGFSVEELNEILTNHYYQVVRETRHVTRNSKGNGFY